MPSEHITQHFARAPARHNLFILNFQFSIPHQPFSPPLSLSPLAPPAPHAPILPPLFPSLSIFRITATFSTARRLTMRYMEKERFWGTSSGSMTRGLEGGGVLTRWRTSIRGWGRMCFARIVR